MIDLMLRFPDEAAAIAALPMLRSDDGWIVASHHHALDIIGPIVAIADERWHANLRLPDCPDCGAILAAAQGFVVTPAQPQRVWA